MKVLLLGPYPPPHGGVQSNLVAIQSFLLRRGVPCAVINITRHRKPQADEVYYPNGAAQLLQLLTRLQFDVLHLHIGGMLTNRLLALALICTLRPRAKSVLTFHSGGFPSSPAGQALGPTSFAGFVLRRFDGLIAVNQEIMEFFRKMEVAQDRTRLISPYAFLHDEQSLEVFPEPLANFFSAHDPVLISVGLLEPEYDLPLQIQVLPRIRKSFPNTGLVMIGSGSLEAQLRETINAQACAPHILLTGDLPHSVTMKAISRSRILLRTTLYDGDALSVREALELNTPVIATDNGMRPEGIILIPKSNLQALVEAIQQELRQEKGRKHVPRRGDINVQAVFELYQSLTSGKDGRRTARTS